MKKEWCAYSGETSCSCKPGECWALKNKGIIDNLNLLLGYGLSIEEAAGDVRSHDGDGPDIKEPL